MTSGGDGLLKLWEVRSGECTATFEEQEGKVWALTSSGEQDKWVASGGADSLVNIWEDASQERLEEADAAKALEVDLQQEFSNALQVCNSSPASHLTSLTSRTGFRQAYRTAQPDSLRQIPQYNLNAWRTAISAFFVPKIGSLHV